MIFCLFALVYCALLVLLLVVHHPKLFSRYYTAAKTATSIGFLTLCFAAALPQGNTYLLWLMLPGMLLCACGDLLLALADQHPQSFETLFFWGAFSFGIAHAAFCVVFALIAPAQSFWQLWMLLPPVLLAATTWLCGRSKWFSFGKLTLAITVYSFIVGIMCAAALRLAALSGWRGQGLWFAVGAFLFIVSDFILLFVYFFQKPGKLFRPINLLAYYLAMLCFTAALAVPLVG